MAAGGMRRTGTGLPMVERVARSRELGRSRAAPQACPARHCWVAEPVDRSATKRPGLLVEWRQTAQGWQGRVVYPAELRPGSWALVEEWVDSTRLAPD